MIEIIPSSVTDQDKKERQNYYKKWYEKNKERQRILHREYYENKNRWFLTLDHVNNNGFEKRNDNTTSNKKEYLIAINEYNTDEYQILCYNCNCSKNTKETI